MSEPEGRSAAGRQAGGDRKGTAARRAPCPVVGIGASAGGLEAFKAFLSSAPVDSGLAYVLVQHLAPDHRSLLAELLQNVTAMPVHEIQGDVAAEPNHVYVIPPNTSLTITGGTLRLAERVQAAGHRAPIDGFFMSLAEDQGENAACVILSGGGHDGTQGLRAIKEHGGLVLAQSADTAAHDSMLRSAVQTGLVDFELPVEEMPAKLRQYFDHLDGVQGKKDADGLRTTTPQDLERICGHLRAHTGHDFSGYKESTLIRRIQRRMQVLEIDELSHYAEHLKEHGQEADLLFKELLIGVTRFFRDPKAFEELAAKVVPNLLEQKGPGDEVRIWVAGCSTGEEVYSLAMLFCERAAVIANPPKLQIFASDIDQTALHVARTGRYPLSIESDVSSERLEQFFVKEDGSYRVRNALREICLFAKHNLLNDPPFSRVDLVSCRNLMIFLNADLQRRLIPILHYSLRPEGYLFLGPSENVSQHAALFAPIAKKSRIFVARRDGPKHLRTYPLSQARSGGGPVAVAASAKRPAAEPDGLRQRTQRILESYAPAYVVIDADGQIVDSSRRTGRYLELGGGTPDLNVFNMARESLRLDLRAAVHQAIKTRRQVVRKGIGAGQGGARQAITLTVEPVIGDKHEDNHYVVLFQPTDEPPPLETERATSGEADAGFVRDLERQLRAAQEHLQTVMEELESSNEELKSSNEEFSLTNEELQSSKEELQSINEELHTVNAELNARNDELLRVNSDLKNLLENTQIATIFLDQDLGIRNFTRAAKDLFRLRDHDTGRPITDITLRFGYQELEQDVREVMSSGTSIEREVSASAGPAGYIMRVMPYRTLDHVADGVVLTFIDISERKRTEDHQTLLLAELSHRVKNMLATVQAIAGQTIRSAPSLEGFYETFNGRLMALAGVHSMLTESSWRGAPLHTVVAGMLKPYESADRISVAGPDVGLTARSALTFSLIFHELATNAVKYGALSTPNGEVKLEWQIVGAGTERALRLSWRETGGPEVVLPQHPGFGLTLIERSVAYELDGETKFDFEPDGIRCGLQLPYRSNNFQDVSEGGIAAE